MKKLLLLLVPIILFGASMSAQKPYKKAPGSSIDPSQLAPFPRQGSGVPSGDRNFLNAPFDAPGMVANPIFISPNGFKVLASDNGIPTMIKGDGGLSVRSTDINEQSSQYLTALSTTMKIKNPAQEFKSYNVQTDELGVTHIRMQQMYEGVKVWGGQVVLHQQNEQINLFNGRYYPTPTLKTLAPSVQALGAIQSVQNDLSAKYKLQIFDEKGKKLIGGEPYTSELILYPDAQKHLELAWHISAHPNVMTRWEYFVNAQTGETLNKYQSSCNLVGEKITEGRRTKEEGRSQLSAVSCQLSVAASTHPPLDGPATGSGTDLHGANQTLNTYLSGGKYYLLDASRPMYDATQSTIAQPIGAIWTLNGQNTSPNGQFDFVQITSTSKTFSDAKAVSGHYNGGKAYEYYKNTFNRNSINGKGGTIISFINVADDDGSGMDNAYWNGEAMFYGNGKTAFTPLVKALDVAGHEMSHGVIQNTANLEYQG